MPRSRIYNANPVLSAENQRPVTERIEKYKKMVERREDLFPTQDARIPVNQLPIARPVEYHDPGGLDSCDLPWL